MAFGGLDGRLHVDAATPGELARAEEDRPIPVFGYASQDETPIRIQRPAERDEWAFVQIEIGGRRDASVPEGDASAVAKDAFLLELDGLIGIDLHPQLIDLELLVERARLLPGRGTGY